MAFLSFDNDVLNLGVQEQEGGLDLHLACCPPALQGKLPPTLLHSGESSSLIQLVASPAATPQPEALGPRGLFPCLSQGAAEQRLSPVRGDSSGLMTLTGCRDKPEALLLPWAVRCCARPWLNRSPGRYICIGSSSCLFIPSNSAATTV